MRCERSFSALRSLTNALLSNKIYDVMNIFSFRFCSLFTNRLTVELSLHHIIPLWTVCWISRVNKTVCRFKTQKRKKFEKIKTFIFNVTFDTSKINVFLVKEKKQKTRNCSNFISRTPRNRIEQKFVIKTHSNKETNISSQFSVIIFHCNQWWFFSAIIFDNVFNLIDLAKPGFEV